MNVRAWLVSLHDLCAMALAWFAAYWLRFNFEIPEYHWHQMIATMAVVLPSQWVLGSLFGVYRGIWRFSGLPDLRQLVLAVISMASISPLILHILHMLSDVPRSVLVLDPLLLLAAMGGSRMLYRSWREKGTFDRYDAATRKVLVLGAGESAAALLREAARGREWRVVGLLDDNAEKCGRRLLGVPVLGSIADVSRYARQLGVAAAIIAMPGTSARARRRAAEAANEAGLAVLTVPSYDDLISGRVAISQVRRVELEDLLGRDQIQLDDEGLHRLLTGKAVLVTGAGGSIGSELARQIARFEPKLLVFYEISEFALYRIEQEFAGRQIACIVGDVKDTARLDSVFAAYRPEVVFHAAAYKHVPMMETDNAWEATRNNVLGTFCVARAAASHGTAQFVLISTDKAVNPTNVMGTTKRLAELVCQALQTEAPATRFVTVRFGNVLGSSGSVIPKFREQIAKGGPITVTHPEIIRYFMLIPEAAQLVLQAGLMGKGGEIFVLDMGEPVKITDLARDMIRLSGLSEDDIRIEFTGLRPGEKLFEELLADGESTLPTPHPKLRIAKPAASPGATWLATLNDWLAAPVRTESDVKAALREWVPEYQPASAERCYGALSDIRLDHSRLSG